MFDYNAKYSNTVHTLYLDKIGYIITFISILIIIFDKQSVINST